MSKLPQCTGRSSVGVGVYLSIIAHSGKNCNLFYYLILPYLSQKIALDLVIFQTAFYPRTHRILRVPACRQAGKHKDEYVKNL